MTMKPKSELQSIIDQIVAADSPVGMDAVYVHALILDQLGNLNERLERLEKAIESLSKGSQQA
jgi:hypothetical protein